MKIADFALERYFARYEFTTPYILCSSDIQGMPMCEVLALADDDARQRWDELTLGYTETAGLPVLREAIASLYHGISADDVITFGGAEEAVFIAANVLLGPGDHMITTWPGYQSLYEVGRAAGAEVTLIELHPEQQWQLDIGELQRAIRPNTKLILLNTPHNPTGSLMSATNWRIAVAMAEAAGAVLFADEVYRLLEFDAGLRLPAACELSATALSLGVMSKAFGLAGLRIGWLVVRDAALRVYRAVRAEGMARVDFFHEENGRGLLVSEVNTIPGFTPISMYPKLWAASGLSYPALIDELVTLALARRTRRTRRVER